MQEGSMGQKDPRVDAYIAKSRDFAKPILNRLQGLVHRGCPSVTEDLKWRAPAFLHQGMLCVMASFKEHCAFRFWKHSLLARRVKGQPARGLEAMGRFGRLTSVSDLPSEGTFIRLVKEAARLNELGVKPIRATAARKNRVLVIPRYFMEAVRANKKALAAFRGRSYSFRKEYVAWVVEAKTEATREKRLRTAIEWMAQGKGRNWKYEK
jgi:hypothetical protein